MKTHRVENRRVGVTRREWLHGVSAGSAGLALSSCASSAKNGAGRDRPNVVMMISDDQAWGDYGFMGHEAIQTPYLDRLASQSVVFKRGYCAAPLCCPSLASILTGLHPHQHKITSNDPPFLDKGDRYDANRWPQERVALRNEMIAHIDKVPTLPKQLKRLGYRSMQTGKWWEGHYSRGGFTHGMTHGDIARGGRHGDEGLKIGRETMRPIHDFLDESDDPFFLWYAPFLPHSPHNPPERFLKKYSDKTDSIHVARYWAMCEWFDETCGQLLQMIEDKGVADNTMIVYVCDNGWIQDPNSARYAERSKRSPYEGGIRTPIMVKWPGRMRPEMHETALANAVDLAPTILHACGLKPTKAMQGINLLDPVAVSERKATFGAAYTHDAVDVHDPVANLQYLYAIAGDWKIIVPSERNETGTEPELYNVILDPDEKTNLAANNPDKVNEMKGLLNKWQPKAMPG